MAAPMARGSMLVKSLCKMCVLARREIPHVSWSRFLGTKLKYSNVPQVRHLSTSRGPLLHGGREWEDPRHEDEIVNIVYILKDGTRIPIQGKVGDNVMYLAHRHEIEIEGACEASLACCTCHVYVQDEHFDRLPEADEKEEDMLDLAPFLKVNSRLSCQIILSKDQEGMEIELPQATRNFYVDGHVPQPH